MKNIIIVVMLLGGVVLSPSYADASKYKEDLSLIFKDAFRLFIEGEVKDNYGVWSKIRKSNRKILQIHKEFTGGKVFDSKAVEKEKGLSDGECYYFAGKLEDAVKKIVKDMAIGHVNVLQGKATKSPEQYINDGLESFMGEARKERPFSGKCSGKEDYNKFKEFATEIKEIMFNAMSYEKEKYDKIIADINVTEVYKNLIGVPKLADSKYTGNVNFDPYGADESFRKTIDLIAKSKHGMKNVKRYRSNLQWAMGNINEYMFYKARANVYKDKDTIKKAKYSEKEYHEYKEKVIDRAKREGESEGAESFLKEYEQTLKPIYKEALDKLEAIKITEDAKKIADLKGCPTPTVKTSIYDNDGVIKISENEMKVLVKRYGEEVKNMEAPNGNEVQSIIKGTSKLPQKDQTEIVLGLIEPALNAFHSMDKNIIESCEKISKANSMVAVYGISVCQFFSEVLKPMHRLCIISDDTYKKFAK